MRFAFVTDELPRPGLAGHGAMNHAVIAWLRAGGHSVTIFLTRPRLRGLFTFYDTAPVEGIGIRHWNGYVLVNSPGAAAGIAARRVLDAVPAGERIARRLRARRYGMADAVLGAFITPAQAAWCGARIAALAPDAVFADTIFRAPVLREPSLRGTRRVLIAHDLFHLRHRALRSAGYRVSPAELPREREAGLLNLADIIAAIQPEEARMIRALCPEKAVCAAPMPALPCPRPEQIPRIPGRLVFVGSGTLPNLDGLRWFLGEIWPRLIALHPAASLDLVGDCGAALSTLPPGVARLGRVKTLSGVLHRAALAISPLRVGSGLKIKMLDYARHGLITVATPQSLAGFAADEAAPFIRAAEPEAFAAALAAALGQPDPDREAAALRYVTRHYSVRASFSPLAAALGLPL